MKPLIRLTLFLSLTLIHASLVPSAAGKAGYRAAGRLAPALEKTGLEASRIRTISVPAIVPTTQALTGVQGAALALPIWSDVIPTWPSAAELDYARRSSQLSPYDWLHEQELTITDLSLLLEELIPIELIKQAQLQGFTQEAINSLITTHTRDMLNPDKKKTLTERLRELAKRSKELAKRSKLKSKVKKEQLKEHAREYVRNYVETVQKDPLSVWEKGERMAREKQEAKERLKVQAAALLSRTPVGAYYAEKYLRPKAAARERTSVPTVEPTPFVVYPLEPVVEKPD